MAAIMQDKFREHLSVADVLKANYSSADDIDRVEAINALENELRQLCCSREANVQANLRGLCEETEKVEAVLREAEPPSVHEARVAALEESQSTAEGRIQQLNNEKR
ncbi:hypothetical protein CVIRNUC_008235 [Coccomyxa viridis]|uniref:Uncharacterized protein n=1 Tax=Coccomyxa viridis TaxID=1274662 RepID=A0AAV1IG94_9CHLO|nr:hypothetical protein CVIRNUC_008235 [Coccomyxa viridis]